MSFLYLRCSETEKESFSVAFKLHLEETQGDVERGGVSRKGNLEWGVNF